MDNNLAFELAESCLQIVNEYLNDNKDIALSVDRDTNGVWYLNFESMENYLRRLEYMEVNERYVAKISGNKWIDADDMLPQEGQLVFTLIDGIDQVNVCQVKGGKWKILLIDECSTSALGHHVIKWMPFPELEE